MENKHVGYLLLGISFLVLIVIFLFNVTLKEIISGSCGLEHSIVCPMNQTVNQQSYLALALVVLLIIVALLLIFSKVQKEIIIHKVKEKVPRKVYRTEELREEDKKVFSLIKENKALFQADLIEKTGFGKAKMSRIIDRLEGKGFVERKRRGMTNVIVLKES